MQVLYLWILTLKFVQFYMNILRFLKLFWKIICILDGKYLNFQACCWTVNEQWFLFTTIFITTRLLASVIITLDVKHLTIVLIKCCYAFCILLHIIVSSFFFLILSTFFAFFIIFNIFSFSYKNQKIDLFNLYIIQKTS